MAAGVVVAWVAAVFLLLCMTVVLFIVGTQPLLVVINYFIKRKIEADIWDKSYQTSIVGHADADRLTEVNYNHQLELTYEVDDGTLLTTYYAVLPVTADEFAHSQEGEKLEVGHFHSKLLGISRILPELSSKIVIKCAACILTPIITFIILEIIQSACLTDYAIPSAISVGGPFFALLIGITLYAVAFGFNLFNIRHDMITSQIMSSIANVNYYGSMENTYSSNSRYDYPPTRSNGYDKRASKKGDYTLIYGEDTYDDGLHADTPTMLEQPE